MDREGGQKGGGLMDEEEGAFNINYLLNINVTRVLKVEVWYQVLL